jgi:hypothetical protein
MICLIGRVPLLAVRDIGHLLVGGGPSSGGHPQSVAPLVCAPLAAGIDVGEAEAVAEADARTKAEAAAEVKAGAEAEAVAEAGGVGKHADEMGPPGDRPREAEAAGTP